ncbi:multidrug DMT transporter permease, partial [Bifidobacteriaceae bacterium NR003]
YDLQIVSTLGLTKDDVASLQKLSNIREIEAERFWKATAHPDDDASSTYAMNFVHYDSQKNMNRLHLLHGNMPTNNREAVVTQRFLHDSGLNIGSTVVVNLQQSAAFGSSVSNNSNKKSEKYNLLITGSVLDSNDLNNPEGYQSKAFRNSVTSRYPIFTSAAPSNMSDLPYSAISVRLNDTKNVNAFSKSYRNIVDDASEQIREKVQSKREKVRRNQIIDEIANREAKNIIANDPRLKLAPNSVKEQVKAKILKQIRPEIQKKVPQAQWHISTRIANDSYASLRSDVASIQSLGYAFPAVFLVVAMMMSLTAMARMVEEERSLIGTYLSLGYGRSAAVTRHAFFAILACFIGGGVGDIVGFLAIPSLLLKILRGLYAVPGVSLRYDWLYGSL